MKAVYIQQHGPIESLRVTDRPDPRVNAGEVLVQVEAAGINPSDIASAEGRFPGAVLPRIIGRDFTGRIVRGPDELSEPRYGERAAISALPETGPMLIILPSLKKRSRDGREISRPKMQRSPDFRSLLLSQPWFAWGK